MLLAWAILAVSVAGLLDALYFTLVTYRLMEPDARWVPRVCRMDRANCARIVETPQARLMGVPNSVAGLVFYAACATAGAWIVGGGSLAGWVWGALVLSAAVAVGVSAYLAWSLVARIRVSCPLCFAAHALNAALLALLVAAR